MYGFIKKLFDRGGITRKIFLRYVLKREGSPAKSRTLRRLYYDLKGIDAGIGSYGWQNEYFDGPAEIGKYTSIGPGVTRICVNHNIDSISTHPCYFNPIFGWVNKDSREKTYIRIGNDVWIGSNAVILPSVTEIGDGAVIGAGAVVTKNIPPYAIVGGVPAKVIKMRFSDDMIARIQNSKWWDYSEDILKDLSVYSSNPETFLQELEKRKNK